MMAKRMAGFLMGALLCVACEAPACGAEASSPPRYTLTARDVARAISASVSVSSLQAPGSKLWEGELPGREIPESQISLLARVVATDPHPILDIKSVEPLNDGLGAGQSSGGHLQHRSKVKLACHLAGACLPFYVIVSWPAEQGGNSPAVLSAARAPLSAKPQHREITMRAGTHATLLMDGDRARISLAVISLQSGLAGDRIRVATPDRKQLFVAEVVNATLLKGSF